MHSRLFRSGSQGTGQVYKFDFRSVRSERKRLRSNDWWRAAFGQSVTALFNSGTLVILGALHLSLPDAAASDRLLIERNSKPLLAESAREALEPWETPIEGFFVRSHHNSIPSKVDDSWTVSFDGLLGRPGKITVKKLKKMKQVSLHAVLECSGNGRALFKPRVSGVQWKQGAVGNAEWTGVRLADVLKPLGVKKGAIWVTIEAFDEPVINRADPATGKLDPAKDMKFIRSLPLKLLLDSGAVLAMQMNRQPMPIVHGGPVRLVIPGIYGHAWMKWVTRLVFSSKPDERMYAKKAYRMPVKPMKPGESWDPVKQGRPVEAILVQSLITSLDDNARVGPGELIISGKAFTGTGTVAKVDISMDRGRSWTPAKLGRVKDFAWREFEFPVKVKEGRSYEIWTRATDSSGNVQPVKQEWNPKGYLYNAVDKVRFKGDAAGARLADGAVLAAAHCQTCHSLGIAEGHRLPRSGWIGVVKKMADYGLNIGPEDGEKIAAYFAATYPVDAPLDDSKRVELAADPSSLVTQISHGALEPGNPLKGKKAFAANCATCHGSSGQGMIGPRLKGRAVTAAVYWAAVMNGQRAMPAFKGRLTAREMADIRAWTQQSGKR